MLDLVEKALSVTNLEFSRIDGSRNDRQRRSALNKFRTSSSCTVLLATLGSAGVG